MQLLHPFVPPLLTFQSVSVAVGVCSLHNRQRDAGCPLHDLRTASTRNGRCSGQPHAAADVSEHRRDNDDALSDDQLCSASG